MSDEVPEQRPEAGQGEARSENGGRSRNCETIAMMPWQREEGRLSRRERRSTSVHRVHSVSGGPTNTGANARNTESEEEDAPASRHGRERPPTGLSVPAAIDSTNLQLGAPLGTGVQSAGTPSMRVGSPSSAAPRYSVGGVGTSVQQSAETYPSFSPLTQSADSAAAFIVQDAPADANNVLFLDEDFQECWWLDEQERMDVLARGWVTLRGDQVVVYATGGSMWTGPIEEYALLSRKISEEARAKQEARTLVLPRRAEAARAGALRYLRQFRRETGNPPSRSTWLNVWQGELDAGGRQITVRLNCSVCKRERILGLGEADTKPVVYFSRGFLCALLCDVQYGELSPGQKGETLRLKQDSRAPTVDVQRRSSGVKKENQEETELEEDVEVVGLSTAAKQFYKARGP